jgi:uncharacterized protein YcfJ
MNNIRMIFATGLLGMGIVCANEAMATTECHDRVVYRERTSDNHHVIGTAVGAVAGAVIGHQFGGGSGKALTTVGGAVAGGAIGHHIAKDESRRYRTVERVCTQS